MLAAINTDDLSYFSIDEWLGLGRKDNYLCGELRTSEMFDNNIGYVYTDYYRVFANNEHELINLMTHDIWEGYDTYNDPDILIDNPFPFYLIDVETKKVLKKVELSIKKYIRIETVGA